MLRGNRSLNQRHVVRAVEDLRTRLEKIADLHFACDVEEFVFQIQHLQLAAVTGSQFENRQARFCIACHQNSSLPKNGSIVENWNTGPCLQMKAGPSWQCPQKPMAHFIL